MLFPSPAEMEMVRILGGKVLTIQIVRHWHSGFPLAFIVWRPRIFKAENVRREVRVGAMYTDLAQVTPYGIKAIEVDSARDAIPKVV